jgi:hypothetical protein
VAGRLAPDDFEQLAAAFRPSWEFDEAPFTGPGSMSPSELQLLQSAGGTHADVRAPAPPTNGIHRHAVPKPTAMTAPPEDSVIVASALTAADAPPPVSAPAPTPFGPPVSVLAPVTSSVPGAALVVPARSGSPDRLAQTRIVQHSAPATFPLALAKESTGSFDVGRRSRRPLWIALGAGAVALAAVGIWSASGSSDAPAPVATIATTAPTRPPPDIPPPPDTTPPQAAQPPPAPAPTVKTVPVSALAQVPMPVQTSSPPPARPAVAPSPPPAPAPRPIAPAPRPVARPKTGGGGTIVHDVPF